MRNPSARWQLAALLIPSACSVCAGVVSLVGCSAPGAADAPSATGAEPHDDSDATADAVGADAGAGNPGPEAGTGANTDSGATNLPDSSLDSDAGTAAPPPCTTTIGSGLVPAITAAAGGAVICLTGGTYASSALNAVAKTSDVVVRPASGAAVTITGLIVNSCKHLHFTGLGGTMSIAGIDVDQVDGSPASMWMTFDHIAFTEAITLRASGADLHWLIDHNTFKNIAAALYEGRISVRGYNVQQDQGIVISNNLFSGGGATHSSDGVQLIGGANGVVVRGNEFTNLIEGNYPEHVDPIQLYGAVNSVIDGNYFHDNGNGTGGLEDFDGSGPNTVVTNNVFVSNGIFPWSMAAHSAKNWRIEHNTFVGAGQARIDGTPSGTIVRDNVWLGGGLSLEGGGVSNDHNLNSNQPGAFNLTGTPTFVGGAHPTTYAGYALAPGSVGQNASSTGTNMGIP